MSKKSKFTPVIPDDYIEMNCGIKIPLIEICNKDDEDDSYMVAPREVLSLIQDENGNIKKDIESEFIDNQIFYFADHFAKDKLMIAEIEASTDIDNLKLLH